MSLHPSCPSCLDQKPNRGRGACRYTENTEWDTLAPLLTPLLSWYREIVWNGDNAHRLWLYMSAQGMRVWCLVMGVVYGHIVTQLWGDTYSFEETPALLPLTKGLFIKRMRKGWEIFRCYLEGGSAKSPCWRRSDGHKNMNHLQTCKTTTLPAKDW